MKNFLFCCFFSFVWITSTGCISTSIADSLALIEQEENRVKDPVNKKVLMNIQALRISQKAAKRTYTFIYDLDNKELSYSDKMTIAKLLVQKNQAVINIAPAKGANKLKQLNLSMERAKALRQYITRFDKEITIIFSPELSIDTLNLVVGA